MTEVKITALFDEWNNALQTKDPEQVANLYAGNAILLTTMSNRVRHTHKEIKDYFSDAKKGTLTLKGALYLEGSLFVEVNGNHKVIKARKENRDKLILEIAESHIEKIIRALGSSRSVKMFHPLIRWACRLHPKKEAFILEGEEGLYEWKMYSRPRTATEKRAY